MPGIANYMNYTEEIKELKEEVPGIFKHLMQVNNGDYLKFDTKFNKLFRGNAKPYFNVDRIGHANFEYAALMSLVGGTQQIDLYVNSIKFNHEQKTYSAELIINLIDSFGVDENDTELKKGLAGKIEYLLDYDDALRAMWILQHQRGYKPFRTIFQFKLIVTGKY